MKTYTYSIIILLFILSTPLFSKNLYWPNWFNENPEINDSRMRQSENFVIYWGEKCGNDPRNAPDQNLRFDPEEVLGRLESDYNLLVRQEGFIDGNSGGMGTYKVIVVAFDTWNTIPWNSNGAAYGWIIDDTVGVIASAPSGLKLKGLMTHEFVHVLQGQIPTDLSDRGLMCPDCGFFWEANANYHSARIHGEWVELGRFLNMQHIFFMSGTFPYQNFLFQQYIADNYGMNMLHRIWNESRRDETPQEVLARLNGLSQKLLNDEFGRYALRNVTLDYSVGTRMKDFHTQKKPGRHFTRLERMQGQDNTYNVPYYMAPQDYGYNIVQLAPESNTANINMKFFGLPNDNAGGSDFRFGFVAVDGDGNPRYSTLYTQFGGEQVTADFSMRDNESELYLVVMGASATRVNKYGGNIPGWPKVYRYPWQIQITGATPFVNNHQGVDGAPHPNGGGFVASTANVAASVYVGADACVMGYSNVRDNAVIADMAYVENADISGNARVIHAGMVTNATLRDNAVISETAWVEWGTRSGDFIASGNYQGGEDCSAGHYRQWPNWQNGRTVCDGLTEHPANQDVNPFTYAHTFNGSNNRATGVSVKLIGSINGHLFNDEDGDNTQWNTQTNTWNGGIPSRTIRLFNESGVVASTLTDATGYYRFENLSAGRYYINFQGLEGWDWATPYVGEGGANSDARSFWGDNTADTHWITLNRNNLNIGEIDAGISNPGGGVDIPTPKIFLEQTINVDGTGWVTRNTVTVDSGQEVILDMAGDDYAGWAFTYTRPDGTTLPGGADGLGNDQIKFQVDDGGINEGVWNVSYTDPEGQSGDGTFTIEANAVTLIDLGLMISVDDGGWPSRNSVTVNEGEKVSLGLWGVPVGGTVNYTRPDGTVLSGSTSNDIYEWGRISFQVNEGGVNEGVWQVSYRNDSGQYGEGTFNVEVITVQDSDNDGVIDSEDAFPDDPSETLDSDGDGVGNNTDTFPNDPAESADSDGDGVGNNADAFPNDPTESADSDGDGVGNNADAFPNDPTESADSDGDGVGDNADSFPNNPTETIDSDGDGVGDNSDPYPNDACLPGEMSNLHVLFSTEHLDGKILSWHTEEVATHDNRVSDPSSVEAGTYYAAYYTPSEDCFCPTTPVSVHPCDPEQVTTCNPAEDLSSYNALNLPPNTELSWHTAFPVSNENRIQNLNTVTESGDYYASFYDPATDCYAGKGQLATLLIINIIDPTLCNNTGLDSDGDGIPDTNDAFPNDPTETTDSDGDGIGDNGDAFPNDITESLDTDGDGIGNNVDIDDDGDGVSDVVELSYGRDPLTAVALGLDSDGDGFTDVYEMISGSDPDNAESNADISLEYLPDGNFCCILFNAYRGVKYRILTSTDLSTWTESAILYTNQDEARVHYKQVMQNDVPIFYTVQPLRDN